MGEGMRVYGQKLLYFNTFSVQVIAKNEFFCIKLRRKKKIKGDKRR